MDDTLTAEPCVSSDGKVVVFVAYVRNQSVQCSITRAALERHFWLPAGANEGRTLKAFADGHQRITAAIERRISQENRRAASIVGSGLFG